MRKCFAGIGARNAPHKPLEQAKKLSEYLVSKDYVLRSGGALKGMDKAFKDAFDLYKGSSLIFTPNRKWILTTSKSIGKATISTNFWNQAEEIASNYHPTWHKCNDYAKACHTRNVFQVLSVRDFLPVVEFVICYTLNGKDKGGTGLAMRIAWDFNIPVYNLFNLSVEEIIKEIENVRR